MIDLTKIDFRCLDLNSKYFNSIIKLRYQILFEPFGRDISDFKKDIDIDKESYHVAAIYEDNVVGYCRLTKHEDTAQISRVFVIEKFSQKGIGYNLIKSAITMGSNVGIKYIYLDSRADAVKFYEKLGFVIEGEEFISEKSGLKLIRMIKLIL